MGIESIYIIYIIESKEGYRYTGITTNITQRLKQHNGKSLSLWTRRGSEWKLIYSEKYEDKSKAIRREKWLKSGAGREYLKKVLRNFKE